MVENYISRIYFNNEEFLSFEVINELGWSKVYYNNSKTRNYLGANVYSVIIDKITHYLFMNEVGKLVKYQNDEIFCFLILSDPYFCLYKTVNNENSKIYFQNSNVEFTTVINIDNKLLRLE